MFRNALYYPHILLPQGYWLRKAILFWETINPIVPYGVKIPKNHITNVLQQEGCLRFIRPEDFLEYEDGVRFTEDFVHFLETPGFLTNVGRKTRLSGTYTVHENKFGYVAMAYLEKKGLAKRHKGPWMIVPKEIGLQYMMWLACAIAKKAQLAPITDESAYHERLLLSQVVPQGRGRTSLASYESVILDNALPVPREDVPLKTLLKFRTDHRRELLAFTEWIAHAADELKKITDKHEVEKKMSLLNVQLEQQKLALKERYRENNLETDLAALEVLVDFKTKDLLPIAIGGGLGTVWGGPVGGVIGAGIATLTVAGIKIYCRFCRARINEKSLLREYPTAYLFSIEKHLLS